MAKLTRHIRVEGEVMELRLRVCECVCARASVRERVCVCVWEKVWGFVRKRFSWGMCVRVGHARDNLEVDGEKIGFEFTERR